MPNNVGEGHWVLSIGSSAWFQEVPAWTLNPRMKYIYLCVSGDYRGIIPPIRHPYILGHFDDVHLDGNSKASSVGSMSIIIHL